VGFYIECEANYTTIIGDWVANQKTLLARALNAAPALASLAGDMPSTAVSSKARTSPTNDLRMRPSPLRCIDRQSAT
jgi:hypothetical protein